LLREKLGHGGAFGDLDVVGEAAAMIVDNQNAPAKLIGKKGFQEWEHSGSQGE
jgi:hypothetical protein